MLIIILGLIVFFISISFNRGNENMKRFGNPLRIIGFIIILIGVVTSCIIQIDAGDVGVKKLFGKVQDDVL